SDLSGLPFSGPLINVLSGIQAFDSLGNQISSFQITGVTVMQGSSTVTLSLENFMTSSPVTYVATDNPFNQVTVKPGEYNLGFKFNSNPSLQYSYKLAVSGVPD